MQQNRKAHWGAALCIQLVLSTGSIAGAHAWTYLDGLTRFVDGQRPEETKIGFTHSNPSGMLRSPHLLSLSDRFERPSINEQVWWMGQAHKGQYWIDSRPAGLNRTSVAIRVTPNMRGCGAACQKNEIRSAPRHRIAFGTDAWYSFSFRLDGELPQRTTRRWVSGQWKQQNGGSPFLAQRFDRGIFQITVQDNHCRVIVASSDPSAQLPITRRTGRAPDPNAPCLADIAVKYGANPVLPAPHRKWVNMSYRVRGGRLGTGLIEIHANGRFIARITGSIGYDHAKGPNQYFKFGIYRNLAPGLSIARFANFRRTGTKPMEFGQSAKLTP